MTTKRELLGMERRLSGLDRLADGLSEKLERINSRLRETIGLLEMIQDEQQQLITTEGFEELQEAAQQAAASIRDVNAACEDARLTR